jgi:PEP-CTERM motif
MRRCSVLAALAFLALCMLLSAAPAAAIPIGELQGTGQRLTVGTVEFSNFRATQTVTRVESPRDIATVEVIPLTIQGPAFVRNPVTVPEPGLRFLGPFTAFHDPIGGPQLGNFTVQFDARVPDVPDPLAPLARFFPQIGSVREFAPITTGGFGPLDGEVTTRVRDPSGRLLADLRGGFIPRFSGVPTTDVVNEFADFALTPAVSVSTDIFVRAGASTDPPGSFASIPTVDVTFQVESPFGRAARRAAQPIPTDVLIPLVLEDDTVAIPEPTTLLLLGTGAIMLGGGAWRKRRKALTRP